MWASQRKAAVPGRERHRTEPSKQQPATACGPGGLEHSPRVPKRRIQYVVLGSEQTFISSQGSNAAKPKTCGIGSKAERRKRPVRFEAAAAPEGEAARASAQRGRQGEAVRFCKIRV